MERECVNKRADSKIMEKEKENRDNNHDCYDNSDGDDDDDYENQNQLFLICRIKLKRISWHISNAFNESWFDDRELKSDS